MPTIVRAFVLLSLIVTASSVPRETCSRACTKKQVPDRLNGTCSMPTTALPSLPTITVTPRDLVIANIGEEVTLSCSISHVNDISFSWELNGTVINNSSKKLVFNLTSNREGSYRCIAYHGQNASVSESILVRIPRVDGWIDTISSQPNHQSPTDKILPQAGSTVLECQPNTNYPSSIYHVTWLRNNASINGTDPNHVRLNRGSLMVQNFLPPDDERSVQYECIVVGLQYHNAELRRHFILRLAEDSITNHVFLSVNQTVTMGGNVTLSCITNSSPNVTWLKDGHQLDYKGLRLDGLEPLSEVLCMKNVTVDNSGVYSCMDGSGVKYNTSLTVIAPPTHVSILSNSRISDDIITNDAKDVRLTCLVRSMRGQVGIIYQWYFRGVAIPSLDQPHVTSNGNVLTVTGSLQGFVQCFVRNKAGSTSAAVSLLSKPRPPVNLIFKPKSILNSEVYALNLSPNNDYATSNESGDLRYEVKVQVSRNEEPWYDEYTCNMMDISIDHSSVGFDFPVLDCGICNDKVVYLEAALIYRGIRSDYVSFFYNNNCRIPVNIQPSSETFLHERNINYVSTGTGTWNMTVSWLKPESVSSCLSFCDVSLHCDGMKVTTETCNKEESFTVTNVSGCVRCVWDVTYSNADSAKLKDSLTFTTKSTNPIHAPYLINVTRARNDSHTVQISFTLPEQSCPPTGLSFLYFNSTSNYTKNISIPDTSVCVSSLWTYTCAILLDRAECWEPYNISVAYRNDPDHLNYSPYSDNVSLQILSEGDMYFRNISLSQTNSKWLTVNYEFNWDIICLLKAGRAKAKICWQETRENQSHCNTTNCSPVDLSSHHGVEDYFVNTWNSSSLRGDKKLRRNTTFIFNGVITYKNFTVCSNYSVVVQTPEDSPVPKDNTGNSTTDSGNSFLRTSHYHIILPVMAATTAVTLAAVFLLIIIITCVIKHWRRKKRRELLLEQLVTDGEIEGDPVDIYTNYMTDAQSEATDVNVLEGNYILQRFLVEPPDGRAQEFYNEKPESCDLTEPEHTNKSSSDKKRTEGVEHNKTLDPLQMRKKEEAVSGYQTNSSFHVPVTDGHQGDGHPSPLIHPSLLIHPSPLQPAPPPLQLYVHQKTQSACISNIDHSPLLAGDNQQCHGNGIIATSCYVSQVSHESSSQSSIFTHPSSNTHFQWSGYLPRMEPGMGIESQLVGQRHNTESTNTPPGYLSNGNLSGNMSQTTNSHYTSSTGELTRTVGSSSGYVSTTTATETGDNSAAPQGYETEPGDYSAAPQGYDTEPGDYSAAPQGYETEPGDYSIAPGDYITEPGGHSTAPRGHSMAPGDYSTKPGVNSTAHHQNSLGQISETFEMEKINFEVVARHDTASNKEYITYSNKDPSLDTGQNHSDPEDNIETELFINSRVLTSIDELSDGSNEVSDGSNSVFSYIPSNKLTSDEFETRTHSIEGSESPLSPLSEQAMSFPLMWGVTGSESEGYHSMISTPSTCYNGPKFSFPETQYHNISDNLDEVNFHFVACD